MVTQRVSRRGTLDLELELSNTLPPYCVIGNAFNTLLTLPYFSSSMPLLKNSMLPFLIQNQLYHSLLGRPCWLKWRSKQSSEILATNHKVNGMFVTFEVYRFTFSSFYTDTGPLEGRVICLWIWSVMLPEEGLGTLLSTVQELTQSHIQRERRWVWKVGCGNSKWAPSSWPVLWKTALHRVLSVFSTLGNPLLACAW